jgi:hypothetical protein
VWVKAKNASGSSGFSAPGNGTPNPPPVPAAPGALEIRVDNNRLLASWSAVAEAASYEVYYSTGTNPAAATEFTGDANKADRSAVITGLTNGTSYNVWVKAKNVSGISGFSPMGSGTPNPTTAKIGILGWTNNDQAIFSVSVASPITLSKTGSGGHPTTLTVTVDGAYTVAEWRFDGEPRPETGVTFTVNAVNPEHTSGVKHRLGVTALQDGIQYSADIHFTVVD